MKGWIYPGAKVVCVSEQFGGRSNGLYNGEMPRNGLIYTVLDVEAYEAGDVIQGYVMPHDVAFISLNELGPTVLFDSCHFRPLQKRKTDISVFHEILDKAHERTPLQVPLS